MILGIVSGAIATRFSPSALSEGMPMIIGRGAQVGGGERLGRLRIVA